MKCQLCDGKGEYMHAIGGYRPCEYCNGTGEVEVVGDSVTDVCDKCGGTGEVELTKEEWLRNLSFDELARVLYCMIINGERIRPDLAYIKRWLKEKHDG